MHPVEILLPLRDNSGRPFAAEKYAEVRQTGGGDGARRDCRVRSHDRNAGRGWWRNYRIQLERDCRQDEVIVRA
jgi:hypothetical protein